MIPHWAAAPFGMAIFVLATAAANAQAGPASGRQPGAGGVATAASLPLGVSIAGVGSSASEVSDFLAKLSPDQRAMVSQRCSLVAQDPSNYGAPVVNLCKNAKF